MNKREILFIIKFRTEANRALKTLGRDLRQTASASDVASRRAREAVKSFRAAGAGAVVGSKGVKTLSASMGGASVAARGLLTSLGPLTAAFGVGATILSAAKATTEFESSLSKVVGLVGVAEEEVEGFGKAILDLGGEVGKTPTELADALFFVTSAGLRGAKALDVLTLSAKAGSAGLGETKVVADALTSALNAYEAAGLTAEEATDILAATVKEGKLEADQFAASLGKILPTAEAAGVSLDEVGGTVAALTRIGATSSQALTGLRGILASLTRENEAGAKVLADLNLSYAGLREQIREEGLLVTLTELREKIGDNETAFVDIFGEIEAVNAVLALTGSQSENVAQIFDNVKNSTGALDFAFGEASKTIEFKFNSAVADIQAALIKLGSVILPPIADLLVLIAQNIDLFAKVALALAVNTLGGKLIPALIRSVSLFGGVGGAAAAAAAGVKVLKFALRTIGIGLVIEALANAIDLFQNFDEEVRKVQESLGKIDVKQVIPLRGLKFNPDAQTRKNAEDAGKGLAVSLDQGFLDGIKGFEGGLEAFTTGLAAIVKDFRPGIDAAQQQAKQLELLELALQAGDERLAEFGLTQKEVARIIEDVKTAQAAETTEIEKATAAANDRIAVIGLSNAQKSIEVALSQARTAALKEEGRVDEAALAVLKDRLVSEQQLLAAEQARQDAKAFREGATSNLDDLRQEAALIGLTNNQRRRAVLLTQLKNDAQKAGVTDITAEVTALNAEVDALEAAEAANRGDALAGVQSGISGVVSEFQNLNAQFASFTDGALRKATDALTEFVTTGTTDFKALADSIVQDLIRIGIQLAITSALGGGTTGGFGAGGGDAAVGGLSAIGSFFAKGGVVGSGGEKGPVPAGAFKYAKHYQRGGSVGANAVPIIAHRGETVLTEDQSDFITRALSGRTVGRVGPSTQGRGEGGSNDINAGGGDVNVAVQMTVMANDPGAFNENIDQISSDLAQSASANVKRNR